MELFEDALDSLVVNKRLRPEIKIDMCKQMAAGNHMKRLFFCSYCMSKSYPLFRLETILACKPVIGSQFESILV